MTTAAVTCTLLALAAELVGIRLLVVEGQRAAASLQRWRDANPAGHAEGSYGQGALTGAIVDQLLSSQTKTRRAVALLVTGVLLGTAGNLLGLHPT